MDKKYDTDNIRSIFSFSLQPKNSCGAYGNVLTIRPDGNLSMCANLMEDKFNVGNIKTMSMEQIQENVTQKKKSSVIKDIFLLENHNYCESCDVKYFCSGPCAAEAKDLNDYLSLKQGCYLNRVFLRYTLYIYNCKLNFQENLLSLEKHLQEAIQSL